MAGKHRRPDVPSLESQRGKGPNLNPEPRETIKATLVDDDSTRETPVVRRPRKATTPRKRTPAPKGTVYESRGRQRARRAGAVAAAVGDQATEAARRAAIRQSAGGKPSVAGRAGAGALAGAGTGAAIGTAVAPGIGTAIGAGVGAVAGGAMGGAAGAKEKRAYKAAMRAETSGPRKLLLAEFLICMVIAAFSPMTKDEDTPGRLMKQLTALMLLFFGLGLLTSAGRGAARVAAAAGGVVTLALVFSHRNFIAKVAEIFNRGNRPAPTTAQRIPAGER